MKKCENKSLSFESKFPNLLTEWDYDKNDFLPSAVFPCARVYVWWKCAKGHSWNARLDSRTNKNRKSGCPFCSRRQVDNSNSLFSLNPNDIMLEWDYDYNKIDPKKVSVHSGLKAFWKCSSGHKWESKISDRADGTFCPYCNGNKIDITNCIYTLSKELMEEWDYSKNVVSPFDIGIYSHKKIWWICKKGHSWAAEVNQRNSLKTQCPLCRKNIMLKDGKCFDSLAEAYYYVTTLKYRNDILFNLKYPKVNGISLGQSRYDFYLENDNLYVEVTGYTNRWEGWGNYIQNIQKKEIYVKNILKSNFKFIPIKIGVEEKQFVDKYME